MIFKLFSLSLKPYVNYVTPLIHSDFGYVSTYFRLRRYITALIDSQSRNLDPNVDTWYFNLIKAPYIISHSQDYQPYRYL